MMVKELMNKKVISTDPETTIREAARAMTDNHVGSLVVIENNKVVGILTERDILISLAKNNYSDVDQLKVKDIMTRWIITVEPEDSIEKAVDLMMKNKIKKLPVVKNEKLVGIITSSDIAVLQPKLIEKLSSLLSVQIRY